MLGQAQVKRAAGRAVQSQSDRAVVDIQTLCRDIARAGTADIKRDAVAIPLAAYKSPALFAMEVERLFRPGWLPIGHVDQVPEPGSYYSLDLLGEPMMMARDAAGAFRVFSRLCPHRGATVVEGNGTARLFSCPYHRWTFNLAGACVGAPLMEGSIGFDRADYGLRPVRFEVWKGFVFINLDGKAPPLGPQLARLAETLSDVDLEQMTVANTMDFGELEIDWKIVLENAIECYHHLGIHGQSLQSIFPAQLSRVEPDTENYAITYSVAKADGVPKDASVSAVDLVNSSTGRICTIFPLTKFNLRANAMTFWRLQPLEAGRVRMAIHYLIPKSLVNTPRGAKMVAANEARTRHILGEDLGMCMMLQKNAGTRFTRMGRLAQLEEAVWRFYRYLASNLFDDPHGVARVGHGLPGRI